VQRRADADSNADAGHPATSIDVEARNAWYDGTTNPATDLQTALGKVVDDLTAAGVGASGAHRVGIAARANWADGGGHPAGDVFNAVNQVVGDLAATTNPSGADHVGTRARSNWYGGTTNPAGTLYAAIEKVIADLAATGATAGADLVGAKARASWYGGTTNPITSVQGALAKIVDDLKATTGSDCIGSAAWSAETPVQLSSGSVMSQLAWLAHEINSHLNDASGAHAASAIANTPAGNIAAVHVQTAINELDTEKAGLALANTFTATQTIDVTDQESPRLASTTVPASGDMVLIARFRYASSPATYVRMYYGIGYFTIAINAVWDNGTNTWVADNTGAGSAAFRIQYDSGFYALLYFARAAGAGTWNDSQWTNTLKIGSDGDIYTEGDSSLTYYTSWEGVSPPGANDMVGCQVNFRKRYSAAPSSAVFTSIQEVNIEANHPQAFEMRTTGMHVIAKTTAVSTYTLFIETVVVS